MFILEKFTLRNQILNAQPNIREKSYKMLCYVKFKLNLFRDQL